MIGQLTDRFIIVDFHYYSFIYRRNLRREIKERTLPIILPFFQPHFFQTTFNSFFIKFKDEGHVGMYEVDLGSLFIPDFLILW